MIIRTAFLISIFLTTYAKNSSINNFIKDNEITCPNYQTGRITKIRKLTELYDKTVRDFWNNEKSKLSKYISKFKNIIFYMANSNVQLWKNTALSVSTWSWIYLRQIKENPNLCAFANIVNSTVTCLDEHDFDPLINALVFVQKTLKEGIYLTFNYAINRAGCSKFNNTKPELSRSNCYKNGYTYDIEKICKHEGYKYPNKYISIIKKLYKSDDLEDKIIALISIAFLSKPFVIITDELDKELKFEIFAMTNTERIPEQCCAEFIEKTKSLLVDFEFETEKLVQVAKKEAKCYDPYHRQMCHFNILRTDDLQPRRLINIRY